MNPVSKLPERLSWIGFGICLVLWLFTLWLGAFWSHSRVIESTLIGLFAAMLFSLISWWRAFLVRRETEVGQGFGEETRSSGGHDIVVGCNIS